MQLQKLVYIAHGWSLAITGQPLTGDRPEAWSFGPMYRRLADCLAPCGAKAVNVQISRNAILATASNPLAPARAILDDGEREVIDRVFHNYACLSSPQLSALTREHPAAPWRDVYADGAGEFRDIPHARVREHFLAFADDIQAHSSWSSARR